MKHFSLSLFLCACLVFVPQFVSAQRWSCYNLNADNGLPSNHIYGLIKDTLGYLWICTDKGVVRYNGYECKVYNQSTGLPTDDIWELVEDRKGRLWIGNISDEFGYLYNGRYRKMYQDKSGNIVYPSHIRPWKNGFIFYAGNIVRSGTGTIYYEQNDSIHKCTISGNDIDPDKTCINGVLSPNPIIANDESGTSFLFYCDKIYRVEFIKKEGMKEIIPKFVYLSEIPKTQLKTFTSSVNIIVGQHIISTCIKDRAYVVAYTNIQTGQTGAKIFAPKATGLEHYYIEKTKKYNNAFYVFTEQVVYKCRIYDTLVIVDSFQNSDIFNTYDISKGGINTLNYDSLWNYAVGTKNNGLWINYPMNTFPKEKAHILLPNYSFIGSYKDSLSFMWNSTESDLAVIDGNMKVKKYHIAAGIKVKEIMFHNKDTFLVCATESFYFINNGKGKIIEDGYGFCRMILNSVVPVSKNENMAVSTYGLFHSVFDGVKWDRNCLDAERYQGITYDSIRGWFWAYNRGKVFIKKKDGTQVISKNELHKLKVHNLEEIAIDSRYGNVFMRGNNNVVMLDPENKLSVNVFDKFNFWDDGKLLVHKNKLIVIWRYGILVSMIKGKMRLSEPIAYMNTKNLLYRKSFGGSMLGNRLLLNTDSGLYSIEIPTDEKFLTANNGRLNEYHFVVGYSDTLRQIANNDTIIIDQERRKLLLDLINPLGNGHARYCVKSTLDSAWQTLNANEINISERYKPDNYYRLQIYAYDDAWKSDVINISLFVRPYWWQTNGAVRLIWGGAISLGLIIIALSVFFTRKMVLKAAERKQLQMELELKAIYAQINPHFIFNSLNSAMLLVSKNKSDEAYNHIAKFSRLLRSYLKSSRNKYIVISEEVENLKNYIELQQTRFKDKFDYEINVSDEFIGTEVKIPSLLIQPFVENAINHGILQKQSKGHLKIDFLSMPGNRIICRVDDDGIGRRQSKQKNAENETKRESYGDLLISDLVSIFNRYEKMNIDIQYIDKEEPEPGTTVTITIKN